MPCPAINTSRSCLRCHWPGRPHTNSAWSAPGVGAETSALDISKLDRTAKRYFINELADSAQRAYMNCQNHFLAFCRQAIDKAVPASGTVLHHFVSYLWKQKLKDLLISCSLSSYFSRGMGSNPPILGLPTVRVMRDQAGCGYSRSGWRQRLPISLNTLGKVKAVWEALGTDPDIVMLWDACFMAFFGFLGIGEMTVPSDTTYDPSGHLTQSDITVDNPSALSVVKITIKQSKTDPFWKEWTFLGGRQHLTCARWLRCSIIW